MRALILAAGAALAVSGCGGDQAANESATAEQSLTADDIGGNDTTAIDAATNDAANMAEDVEFTLNDAENLGNAADNAAENRADNASNATDNRE